MTRAGPSLGLALRRRLPLLAFPADAATWRRCLRENHYAVDPPYWPLALLITLGSFEVSRQRAAEDRRYGPAIAGAEVRPPLFILGHWRAGTSHLHRLLTLDERFAAPTLFDVYAPHALLTTSPPRHLARLLPDRRPMDKMTLSFDAPEEDEIALLLMTGRSPYAGYVFPRHWERHQRYLTFSEVAPAEREAWQRALLRFVKKLSLKTNRPLVLKSPGHTARVRLLLELFPEARFVHIHRDPYETFQSTCHLLASTDRFFHLQRPDKRRIPERVIRQYGTLYRAFFEQRHLIAPHRFHELSYDRLRRDPLAELRTLYGALGLPSFEAARPKLERYLASLRGYRRNEHPQLPPGLRARIAGEWRRSFEEWSYPD